MEEVYQDLRFNSADSKLERTAILSYFHRARFPGHDGFEEALVLDREQLLTVSLHLLECHTLCSGSEYDHTTYIVLVEAFQTSYLKNDRSAGMIYREVCNILGPLERHIIA